jgi:carboxyl-terminal processing protease
VDRATASAAELFAGSLQALGRAVVAGERTYGKGTACAVVLVPGGPRYDVVGRFVLPDGCSLDGAGVEPDEAGSPRIVLHAASSSSSVSGVT